MLPKVVVSKSALFEMVMAAVEAYAVKHDKQKTFSLETSAHLWGSINKKAPFKCTVNHVSVETSAKRTTGSVASMIESLNIKKDIARVFGEGHDYIGSFHSHPYMKDADDLEGPNCIRKYKCYHLSSGDHECEINDPQLTVGKKEYSVALVMTVFAMDRANDQKDGYVSINIHEFSLGNLKLWLKAQVFEHKKIEDLSDDDIKQFESLKLKYSDYEGYDVLPIPVDTNLECDFLSGLGTYLKEFGRVNADLKNTEYRNSQLAENRWFV